MKVRTQQLCGAGRFREAAGRILMEQLGDATVLGHDHIQPMVVVIVEPHRQASVAIGDIESILRRAIDQLAILVDEKLTRVAGAGGNHQVLVTVVVEVGPRAAVSVGIRTVHPIRDLRGDIAEGAVPEVQEQAGLGAVIARKQVGVPIAVQIAPGRTVAFAAVRDPGRVRDVGECDLCRRERRAQSERNGRNPRQHVVSISSPHIQSAGTGSWTQPPLLLNVLWVGRPAAFGF